MFLITFRPFSLPGRIWGLVHSIILTWTVSCQFCLLEIRCLKREHTRSLATASAVTLMRNAFLFFLVLLEITVNLRSLLSPSAAKGLSMKNLLGGNFAISEIQEARINVSSDEGALELNTDQLAKLKSISGHDRLTVDKKNSNQVSFTSTCKVIIASNHNIGMAYSSSDSAIARRICTLPFNVKIPKSQQNPNIVSEILGSELNAVTTEALNAFFRLKANGYHFAGDDAGLDDYALQFTPINAQYHNIERFVQCHVRSMPGNFVLTKDLYDVFQHCLDFNCDVFKDVTGFSQALNNYLLSNGYVVKKVKKHQGNGYEGIAISNP